MTRATIQKTRKAESKSDVVEVKGAFNRNGAPSSSDIDCGLRKSDAKCIDLPGFNNRSSGGNLSSQYCENGIINWNLSENRKINFTSNI